MQILPVSLNIWPGDENGVETWRVCRNSVGKKGSEGSEASDLLVEHASKRVSSHYCKPYCTMR